MDVDDGVNRKRGAEKTVEELEKATPEGSPTLAPIDGAPGTEVAVSPTPEGGKVKRPAAKSTAKAPPPLPVATVAKQLEGGSSGSQEGGTARTADTEDKQLEWENAKSKRGEKKDKWKGAWELDTVTGKWKWKDTTNEKTDEGKKDKEKKDDWKDYGKKDDKYGKKGGGRNNGQKHDGANEVERKLLLDLERRMRNLESCVLSTLITPANETTQVALDAAKEYGRLVREAGRGHDLDAPHVYIFDKLLTDIVENCDLGEDEKVMKDFRAKFPTRTSICMGVKVFSVKTLADGKSCRVQACVLGAVKPIYAIMQRYLSRGDEDVRTGPAPRGPLARRIQESLTWDNGEE